MKTAFNTIAETTRTAALKAKRTAAIKKGDCK